MLKSSRGFLNNRKPIFCFLNKSVRVYFSDQAKMSNECIVAVCQMTVTNDKSKNLKMVENLVQKAKDLNAEMVFLPECCDFIGTTKKETLSLAEKLNGSLMTSYKNLALQNNIWLSLGGVHEIPQEAKEVEKIYNTHALIDNKGNLVTVYRKLHLFDVCIPEKKIDLQESKVVIAGSEIGKPVTTPAGNLGMFICYDVRFPEISTLMRKMGATVLTYPSAFTHSTGMAHWETLLRARAIENQCYVIAAAQVGQHNPKRLSHGHAMVVNPWGKILAESPQHTDDYKESGTVITAVIDSKTLGTVRENMPVFNHRRNDIYNLDLKHHQNSNQFVNREFADKTIYADTIFFQTKYSFAFTNIRCVVPGHVLVSTNRVLKRMENLTQEEIADLFQVTAKVQKMIENYHQTTSSTIVVQDGKDAGQTVPHVHCHILPRKPGDFDRNDDIYDILATHDNPTLDNSACIRDLDVMIEEAQKYRNLMNSLT